MSRVEANIKIITAIRTYAEKYPDQRFHQILQNIGITCRNMPDLWYEESEDTLKRLKSFCESI